jgi:GGDEF domain-containing protein
LALKLTISVGITEFRAHHPDAHAVIAAADAALYQSKRSGRNCVSGPGIA